MKRDLKKEINSSMEDYSRIQKRIAAFLVENWNEIPLLSIEAIAKETGVSTATITRFVRRFNFRGFYDFKDKIKEELKDTINPVARFRLYKANVKGRQSLVQVARQDIKNINKLLATVKDETFDQVVNWIEESRRVYSFGSSISSVFSSLTAYLFNQVRKETHCLNESDLTVEEKILILDKEDLVIFFSFYPYSRLTVQYAQLAYQRGLRVVSISDNAFSPISECSSLVLAIPRENILYATSMAAVSVLINAIAAEIGLKRKEELSQQIDSWSDMLKTFYFFS